MNITILGAGKSGIAAALLAHRKGNTVFLSEFQSMERHQHSVERLETASIPYEFGGHSERVFLHTELIITSPGIPPHAPVIQEAEQRGIPIISELEYASTFIHNPIIAVTGTNGKTTTTTLIAFMLEYAGKKSITAGNIGTPLSELVDTIDPATIIVAETSSYQLDRLQTFHPTIAIILNITPDHLAYHGTFDNYSRAKFAITKNQTAKDLLILNADDTAVAAYPHNSAAQVQYFSMSPMQQGAYKKDRALCIKNTIQHKEEIIMVFDEMRLPGDHNAQNALAAALAVRAFEVSNEDIRDSLMKFAGVEHRLEFVRTFRSVDFINDSKATNVNAAWYALSSYQRPLVWIAGGRGDNNHYASLDEVVKNNVHCIICIGEEKDALFNHYSAMVRCIRADSLEQAVHYAVDNANLNDIVLFSPACKSFDMFLNYEHRGEVFKQVVLALDEN